VLRRSQSPDKVALLATGLLALTVIVCSSCAKSRPETLSPSPDDAVVEPTETGAEDPQPIYDRLEAARREYREGVELLAAGDEIGGEFKIVTASNDIREAAEDCSANPGCDASQVLDTLEALLGEQNTAIKMQSFRIDTMEASIAEDAEREPGTSPFVSTMPDLGETVSLLKGTELRDLIQLNGPVRAALDDWLTWMRPLLMQSYENYQFLRDKVAPVYEEAGMPEALLFAMMATETGVKVHAFSRAGAAGPLQFMRGTGRKYGLQVEDGFDMRLDPVAATRANVAYLNDQFAAFNDSLEKVLAAYNGGENRMRAVHRRNNGKSLWDSEVYYSLPRETREYVPRVLAAAWLFLHPADYNLEFPDLDTETTELVLREDIALGELTVCLGQEGNPNGWFRTLRNLNPRYDPGERIEAGTAIEVPTVVPAAYEERCLDGELLVKAREMHEANYPDEPEVIVYTVRRGDTLGKIASRHRCVSIGELAALNNIRPPRYVIRVGQRLKVPSCP
jgi:membrane-bound lytic murein transglycosylase D